MCVHFAAISLTNLLLTYCIYCNRISWLCDLTLTISLCLRRFCGRIFFFRSTLFREDIAGVFDSSISLLMISTSYENSEGSSVTFFLMCPNDQFNIDKLRSNCAVRHQNLNTTFLVLEVDCISHHDLLSKILHLRSHRLTVTSKVIAVSDTWHRS